LQVDFPGGQLWVRDDGIAPGRQVRLRVLARDVSITLQAPQDTSIQNHFQGLVEAIADDAHPSQALVRVRCGDSVVLARVTRKAIFSLNLSVGVPVWVQVKSVAVIK
jgi:molybdate transport system ATP-binding protein